MPDASDLKVESLLLYCTVHTATTVREQAPPPGGDILHTASCHMASKAKKAVTATIKLVINAGQAKPAPPVGPALGQAGLNIMSFCKDFNAKTADKKVCPSQLALLLCSAQLTVSAWTLANLSVLCAAA